MRNIYDNSEFFAAYAEMGRSKDGLKAAGEWHQLQPLFPKLQGKKVLDLGCGYGWHCKYAAQMGATEILGIDSSQKMIAKAVADNSDDKIKYKVCGVEEYIYPENTYDCTSQQKLDTNFKYYLSINLISVQYGASFATFLSG